jgi:hypothetical protein
MSRNEQRIDRPLLLLTGCLCRPAASRRFGSWSGPRGVAHARLDRRPLGRHPVVQPRRAPPAHLTPDLCRRSPPASDRWHIRQPVPAARFTAVLPRGSSGDIEEPAGTGRGTGTQRKDRCSGGPETSGVVAGNRGGSGLAAGGAGQGRGRPPPATRRHLCSGPLRHGRSGPGLWVAGTRIGRPSPNQRPSCTVYPSRAGSLRSSLRDP